VTGLKLVDVLGAGLEWPGSTQAEDVYFIYDALAEDADPYREEAFLPAEYV
jgi:hypothetical protein